ncbi:hypothetical protein ES332_D10G154300v1 [Gossypium tomentosum]|uniref:PGG domain-containing protein n=1 Tax=Gossypium tomentosum TaxID=34277 RepID=A0A5D2J537_GOSTO|nr:hypothetical protein ES332_D10G154300v1 [Gossypium tomentosum]
MAQDSCIIIPSQQPQPPVEAITFMECDSLKAAEDGDMVLFNNAHHCCFNPMIKGETPLHIAARHGHYKIVKFLIERAKVMPQLHMKTWRIRKQVDKADNTAFHMAVECPPDDIDVFSLSANKSGETPLYIAAMTKTDKKGRTPIHYVADFGNYSAVEQLLEMDASAAYAANIMQYINSHCSASCEIVDERGWNFLHYAALALKERISYAFTGQRCTQKHNSEFFIWKGCQWEHACHLYKYFIPYNLILPKQKREILKEIGNNAGDEGIRHHKSFRENMGNDNNPSTLKEVVDKLRETHLLVAALVATVAFTAANAVPGGYKADDKGTVDEGTAILSHNYAFKTLVMTNAMAVVSSLLAIFLHFLSVFIHLKAAESLVLKCILVTDGLTVFTMAAMVVSSSAGSYAVL